MWLFFSFPFTSRVDLGVWFFSTLWGLIRKGRKKWGFMAEELEELWRKVSFTEEEDEGIILGNSSTRAAKARGRLCAVL